MYEHGQTWELVGPEGTTLQLNPTPSNGIYLEDINGFDMPSVRTNVEPLPEADGAVAGDFFFGARSVTLSGRIIAPSAAERNQLVMNMQRVLRALRGDVVLKSTPSGQPAMQVSARLEQPLRITGGYAKQFLISLICPDPLIYSQTLHTQTGTGTPGTAGAEFPWAFPVDFGGGSGATLEVNASNIGNIATPPVVRASGPISNLQIRNDTTDEALYIDNVALIAGEWLEIDVAARTAVKSDGTNIYDRVRFPDSAWWLLQVGSNAVQVYAASSGVGAQLDVTWRDAWI